MAKQPLTYGQITDMPPAYEKSLNDAYEIVLEHVRSLDPTWDSNAAAAIAENGWSARQAIGAWVGYVLEHDLHMSIPQHPSFEPGVPAYSGMGVCPVCEKEFRITFPGEKVCSNTCAEQYRMMIAANAAATAAVEQHDLDPAV